ncbi:MAG: hypothetical protein WBB15_09505 [Ornithinimicrobium sp.]
MNPPTIRLELSLDHVNLILETLGRQPYVQVHEVINAIHAQASGQLSADKEGGSDVG